MAILSGHPGSARGTVVRTVVAVVCAALMLTGCATGEPQPTLSASERSAIRTALLEQRWSVVVHQFPDAIRPSVTVATTIDDRSWEPAMISCLRADGLTVFVDGRYFQFGETPGRTAEDFALASYRCLSRYPIASDILPYLDRSRLDALFRYYVGTVRPCLLLAGEPSDAPPTRFAFVLSVFGRNSWNPYRRVWDSPVSAARLTFLEQLCPPLPAWLDLGR